MSRAASSPAGRTDAGVHATGQTAHFDCETRLEPPALGRALNAVLPRDVAVLALEVAPHDFHARRDASAKLYAYRILNREAPSPVRARFTWHMRAPLDVAAMAEAGASVVGTHDFSAFRGAPGGVDEDMGPRRTLYRLDVEAQGDEVRIEADGPELPAPHGPEPRRNAGRDRAAPAPRLRHGEGARVARARERRAHGARARPVPGARALSRSRSRLTARFTQLCTADSGRKRARATLGA